METCLDLRQSETSTLLDMERVVEPRSTLHVPAGKMIARKLRGDPEQHYYLYVPKRGGCGAPLLVSVHGISRNARKHVRRFAELAERYGVVVLAPLFDERRFPAYQRLGLSGARSDLALQRMVAEVGALVGADTRWLYLFGYSGGAQFAHRYAMAYPKQVVAMALGAAGWYTLPDTSCRFPHGVVPHRKLPGLRFDAEQFLRIPACVLVGEQDTQRDAALRKNKRLDETQGKTRFERGQRWIEAMQDAARQHGLETHYHFISLPDADHSFSRSVRLGGMAEQVFSYLFGVASSCLDVNVNTWLPGRKGHRVQLPG